MKKFKLILFMICINMLLSCYNAYALEYTDVNIMQRQGTETIISTGAGYMKWTSVSGEEIIYYSNDKSEWQLVSNDENKKLFIQFYDVNNNVVKCIAKETDDYIILIPHSYQFPLGMRYYMDTKITLLDKENFNIVTQTSPGGAIGLTSYIDGVFYALIYTDFYLNDVKDMRFEGYRTATAQKTVYTTDFENWYDYSDDGSIPITNGKTVLMTRNSLVTAKNGTNLYGEREIEPQQVYVRSGENDSEIIYESVDVAQIFPFRDLYIGIPSTDSEDLSGKFLVSYDGVYFTTVDLPYSTQILYTMSEIKDDMILCSINSYKTHLQGLIYNLCSYAELKEYAREASVYVQYEGKTLGFETPPVIEDGSTLVPIRFLFEQMGADVDWNGEMQTATVTQDNTAVTFAIDNTNATVNNAPATMDVPARLIDGKTMVPLRFLSEELGYTVNWDEESRIITIR